PHDCLGGDIGGCARPVLNDEWLTEPLREPLADQARGDIEPAAGSKANDDAYGPGRVVLRPSDTRHGWQRGSACGQMQKLPSVGKFHFEPPFTSFDHLAGAHEQRKWHGEAKRICSL